MQIWHHSHTIPEEYLRNQFYHSKNWGWKYDQTMLELELELELDLLLYYVSSTPV